MTDDNTHNFQKTIESVNHLRALQATRQETCRKLCERPEVYDALLTLADVLYETQTYLCNYQTAVDGYDNPHPIEEVMDKLGDHFREAFLKLTGQEFHPLYVREWYRRKVENG